MNSLSSGSQRLMNRSVACEARVQNTLMMKPRMDLPHTVLEYREVFWLKSYL